MKERTLAVHLEKLKPVEKGFIVWLFNFSKHLGYEVHQGMLPFISVDDTLTVLDRMFGQGGRSRVAKQIREKLRAAYNVSESVTWGMQLDSRKVAKRFGAHPERGHNIPQVMKKRVTVGVRWSLPKRDHEPDDDVLVQPHLVLKPTFKDRWWYVTCEKRYREHVTRFLLDYCS